MMTRPRTAPASRHQLPEVRGAPAASRGGHDLGLRARLRLHLGVDAVAHAERTSGTSSATIASTST